MALNKTNTRLIAADRPFSVIEIKNDSRITNVNGKQSSYNIVGKNGSGIAEFGCNELAAKWFCEAANRYADEIASRRSTTPHSGKDYNSAKLCEAVDEILEKIDKWRTDGTMEHWQYSQLFDIADAALAATPSQDVPVTTTENLSAVGNAAKLREAVDKLVNFLRWEYAQDYSVPRDKLADAIDIGVAALAEPVKNCEVGTAREMANRFADFCGCRVCDHTCPARMSDDVYQVECYAKWSQMPYEEGGTS